MKETLVALAMTSLSLATVVAAPHAGADPTGVPDTDNALPRFVNEIWPAVEGDRGPAQGSPQHNRYIDIRDPTLHGDALEALLQAKYNLGTVNGDGAMTLTISFPASDLNLARATLTSLHGPQAIVSACYTFTSQQWDSKVQSPAAFVADFHLHKTDAWYLNAITDDHPVTDCDTPASS